MTKTNDTLPENLKALFATLSMQQAMPLGDISGLPFLALKIPAEDEALIRDNAIVCEVKPSIFNIDFEETTIAVCFVQLRLNQRSELTYTAYYNLKEERQFNDCYALLNMRKYGLLAATDTLHDFLAFHVDFDAPFEPRTVLAAAKVHATEYSPELFHKISQTLYHQAATPAELWEQFKQIAPFEHEWYARMRLDAR